MRDCRGFVFVMLNLVGIVFINGFVPPPSDYELKIGRLNLCHVK